MAVLFCTYYRASGGLMAQRSMVRASTWSAAPKWERGRADPYKGNLGPALVLTGWGFYGAG